MKKSLAIILCLVLGISMLTACGGAADDAATTEGEAEFTIRFAHIENELTAAAQGVQLWKSRFPLRQRI